MNYMFYSANRFNQDIGDWDISNVANIQRMFFAALAFNQDLSEWCVSRWSSMPGGFSTGTL